MRHCLAYLILILSILSSCRQKHDDGAILLSQEQKDSLLIEYIIQEFDYNQDSNHYKISKREFGRQLDSIKKDPTRSYYYYGSNEAKFKNYQLKSFLFDSQGKPPFVVEITNEKGQFINFFSFTDETFYSGNSISSQSHRRGSIKTDSILRPKINLEKNLNQLIKRLDLKDKHEILDFTKTICYTLNMTEISKDSIQNILKLFFSTNSYLALGDSIASLVKNEQTLFFEKGQDHVLMVNTCDFLGFWRFWIEKNGDRLVIRTAFFSDFLYNPIYM